MVRFILVAIYCVCCGGAIAQPYAIGQADFTFIDSVRQNRSIPFSLYYPAQTAGSNTLPAIQNAPLVVIGHGFVMTIDAYRPYVDSLVPLGYVVALPTTEGSLAPSHENFGKDLLFVAQTLQRGSQQNQGVLYYQLLNGKTALMGHSMGGGASVLGSSFDTASVVTTYVGLAPAETNPAATAAGANVSIPALILAGSADNVTPAPDHAFAIYTAWAGCKTFVSITGGGHCSFAGSSFTCEFGEASVGSPTTLNRAQQLTVVFRYLKPWLAYHLQNNTGAITQFTQALQASDITTQQSGCNLQTNGASAFSWQLSYMGVVKKQLVISVFSPFFGKVKAQVLNSSGQVLWQDQVVLQNGTNAVSIPYIPEQPGLYVFTLQKGAMRDSLKFTFNKQ